MIDGCTAGSTRGFDVRLAVVLSNASKVALDNVLGGDRLARGTFANRNHDAFLTSRRCRRDKGSDRDREGEGEGRGNADHDSDRSIEIDRCSGAGGLRTPRGLYFYTRRRSSGLEIHRAEESTSSCGSFNIPFVKILQPCGWLHTSMQCTAVLRFLRQQLDM